MWEQKRKDNTRKNNSTIWGNKPESSVERREIKRYRQRIKQYQTKQDIPKKKKNERKFYHQLGGHDTKTYQQPDAKETKRFWTKIWQPKMHNENAEWINDMTRELEGLKEDRKEKYRNTPRTIQKDTKKISNRKKTWPWWNTWILVQEIHLHSRQTSTRNEQRFTGCTITWLDDQRKDHINPKGPKQRKFSKQL